jgi:hypothetical protein
MKSKANYQLLTSTKFISNAHFLISELENNEIDYFSEDKSGNYMIFISKSDLSKAKTILEDINLDESNVENDKVNLMTDESESMKKLFGPEYFKEDGGFPYHLIDWKKYKIFGLSLILLSIILLWVSIKTNFDFTKIIFMTTFFVTGTSLIIKYYQKVNGK